MNVEVPHGSAGDRVDRFLVEALAGAYSRTRIQSLLSSGAVLLDGRAVKSSYKLVGGERLSIVLPAPEVLAVEAEDRALDIVYQDPDVAVINKPAGLTVHPSATQKQGTLVNALLAALSDLSGIGGVLRPGIVHRLDKDTSGLLIVAKHDRAHRHLVEQFQTRQVQKHYVAFVLGTPPQAGDWKQPIGRHPTDRKRFSTRAHTHKVAHTQFSLRAQYETCAQIDVRLHTGRTHQIRVHAADNGYPLVGDKLYGGTKRIRALRPSTEKAVLEAMNRQALHAYRLALLLPSGRATTFEAPWPDDFCRLKEALEVDGKGRSD